MLVPVVPAVFVPIAPRGTIPFIGAGGIRIPEGGGGTRAAENDPIGRENDPFGANDEWGRDSEEPPMLRWPAIPPWDIMEFWASALEASKRSATLPAASVKVRNID